MKPENPEKTQPTPAPLDANGKTTASPNTPRQGKSTRAKTATKSREPKGQTRGQKAVPGQKAAPSPRPSKSSGTERTSAKSSGAKSDGLSDAVRRFVVESLACFASPKQVEKEVLEVFGVEMSRQRVQCYDPTKSAGRELSQQWRALFETARAEYLRGIQNVGVANQRYRLESLQEEHDRAKAMKNPRLVKEFLEHAALEIGGRFTNKVNVNAQNADDLLSAMLGVSKDELPPANPAPDAK